MPNGRIARLRRRGRALAPALYTAQERRESILYDPIMGGATTGRYGVRGLLYHTTTTDWL